MENLKLTELIDVHILQKVQDAFAEYTGIAAVIANEQGVPVTKGSNFARVCTEMVRQTEQGRAQCADFARNGAVECMRTGRASVYGCHAGLVDFAVPISVEGRIIGCFIGGQVRNEDKSDEELREIARSLQLDEEEFLKQTRSTRIRTREEVVNAAIFLRKLAEALSDLAYHNYLTIQTSKTMEETATARTHYMEGLYADMSRDVTGWMKEVNEAIESDDAEAKERILKEMSTRGQDVLTFIRDTLVTVRQKNMSLSLRESAYSLAELVDECRNYLQPFYEKKGNTLTVKYGDNVPKNLYGDSERIYRIFVALLYEAGRNTEQGEVKFSVTCSRREYASLLEFKIEDGNAACQEGRYKSIAAYLQQGNGGVGAGGAADMMAAVMHSELSVVDTLLGQLFGGLEIVSEPGKGNTCYMSYPQLKVGRETFGSASREEDDK